jgi:hypothetical protein
MSIEEKILNDNSCSPYVDKGRGYVEIAFKDGAYWGYEEGRKDMIEKATQWLFENVYDYLNPEDQERVESFRKYLEE